MTVEELSPGDREAAARLWTETALTRPWNDPRADFDRALRGSSSTVLGVRHRGRLVATAMVGHDGHRGWVYYLAVDPSRRRTGLGAEMVQAAEEWLRQTGTVKIQLMVRDSNASVTAFYEGLGYTDAGVRVLSRWLTPSAANGSAIEPNAGPSI